MSRKRDETRAENRLRARADTRPRQGGRDGGSREWRKTVVGVVTGAETGQVLGLDLLVERDSDGFDSWSGLATSRAVRDGDATLRRMSAEPVGKWRAPLRHRRRRDVPWANSAAERAIGDSQSGLWDGTSNMDSSVIAVVIEILSNPRHRSGYAALSAC